MELREMGPMVAKKLLKVFHVGITTAPFIDKNGNNTKLVRPWSFTEWQTRVLDNKEDLPAGWTTEFKRSVQNSDHLLNYIKGVIDFVRRNPAILNKDNIIIDNMEDDVDDEELEILRKSGFNIGTYTHPYSDSVEEQSFIAGMMAQNVTAFAPVPTVFPQHASNAFVGVDGVMSYNGLNSMGGGSIPMEELFNTPHANQLSTVLIKLLRDLKKTGLTFDADLNGEITTFVQELGENERKLKEMIKVLTTLRNLQSFVRCYDNGRHSGMVSGKILSLEEISSNRDLLQWLNYNVGDYENCIYKGMEYINAGSQQVLQAYNDLIQSSAVSNGKDRMSGKM